MIFTRGDYDSPGGLYLGSDGTGNYGDDWLLKPFHMTSVFARFPDVKIAMYGFCFSGHWVETPEFQGKNLKPEILAITNKEQE